MCADSHSFEDLRGPLFRFLENFLCIAPFSQVFCPINSSNLSLPKCLHFSPPVSESPSFCLGSFSCAGNCLQAENQDNWIVGSPCLFPFSACCKCFIYLNSFQREDMSVPLTAPWVGITICALLGGFLLAPLLRLGPATISLGKLLEFHLFDFNIPLFAYLCLPHPSRAVSFLGHALQYVGIFSP